MEELLTKVRGHVPFVSDQSQVKFVGEHELVDKSWVKIHTGYNGWRKEGQLLLDVNGDIVGKVTHVRSSGSTDGVEVLMAEEYYPDGEAYYLLSYDIKFNTEKEEHASLYWMRK